MSLYSLEFKIACLIFLISGVLVIFLKPKQEYIEATEARVDGLEGGGRDFASSNHGFARGGDALRRAYARSAEGDREAGGDGAEDTQ